MNLRTSRPAANACGKYYFTYIDQVPDGDIIATLTTQHQVIHELLQHTNDTAASAIPAPGEWSIKQVVQHVSDAERLFTFRALWFARGEKAALPGMEPDPWAALTNSNGRTLQSLLAEFDQVRAATLALFSSFDDSVWQRHGTASGMDVSVHALAWITAGHELHHNRSLREHYL